MQESMEFIGVYEGCEYKVTKEANKFSVYKGDKLIAGPFSKKPMLSWIISKRERLLVAHFDNLSGYMI